LAIAAFALVAAASGCGSSGGSTQGPGPTPPAGPTGATVRLQDLSFKPADVTIKAGQSVSWVWADAPTVHDVTFPDFHSPLQANGTYSHVFATAGTYPFRCSVHPTMTGTVTVTAPAP
jgi:plastocyanin